MTHPTRDPASPLTVADAMRRISDREMTEMCLAVNIMPQGIDPTSKKPWRITEMNAEMMRHAIRLQRLKDEATNA